MEINELTAPRRTRPWQGTVLALFFVLDFLLSFIKLCISFVVMFGITPIIASPQGRDLIFAWSALLKDLFLMLPGTTGAVAETLNRLLFWPALFVPYGLGKLIFILAEILFLFLALYLVHAYFRGKKRAKVSLIFSIIGLAVSLMSFQLIGIFTSVILILLQWQSKKKLFYNPVLGSAL